ncbi:MAG: hypothetical protein ACRELA_18865 [Candidatus Rokuibacteriota bacterium]
MSWEAIGRLFVGIGFLWAAIILIVGILGGFDTPITWISLLGDVTGSDVVRHVYLALTFLVVPIGMLTYLRDILGDPVALWVKVAAPGAFVAIYLLFLLAALPDVGRPFLLWFGSIVPLTGLRDTPDATGSWFLRFLAAFAFLAGIPAVIGKVVSLITGVGSGVRRR